MSPRLEERVAYLEGQISNQAEAYRDLRQAIRNLEERLNALDQKVDRRFDELSNRISSVEQKVDSQFKWLIGLYITTIITVVGALLSLG